MIIFLDTSAWVKYFIHEQGSGELQSFLLDESAAEANSFAASPVTYAEMHGTFARAVQGGRIAEEEYHDVIQAFGEQWGNVDICAVDSAVIENAGDLAREYCLKGCDAFQLASALAVDADLFINADRELGAAAAAVGLEVWDPTSGAFSRRETPDPDEADTAEQAESSNESHPP